MSAYRYFCIKHFWLRPPSRLLLNMGLDPDVIMASDFGKCFSMTWSCVMQSFEEQL